MTQKAHHTEEILADYDLTSIDGYILASFCYIPPLTGGFLALRNPTRCSLQVSANILNIQMYIYIGKIWVGIVMCQYLQVLKSYCP